HVCRANGGTARSYHRYCGACRREAGRIVPYRPRCVIGAVCISAYLPKLSAMLTSQALANVENLLAQMRAVARESQGLSAQPAAPAESGGFSAELARSLGRASHAQNAANTQARGFEMGDPDISLSSVMVDLQKAGLAFQANVQVRNRLVEAYKEIANMAVCFPSGPCGAGQRGSQNPPGGSRG